MLRKHAARFGDQWDKYHSGILWSYRNIPHASTGKKPSFPLFSTDCHFSTKATVLPTSALDQPTTVADYHKQLMISLSSARDWPVGIFSELKRSTHKNLIDEPLTASTRLENGKKRKLSRPWYGLYQIIACREPDVTAMKV